MARIRGSVGKLIQNPNRCSSRGGKGAGLQAAGGESCTSIRAGRLEWLYRQRGIHRIGGPETASGARTRMLLGWPPKQGAERERGESSLKSVGLRRMSHQLQFVQKNQIRPVNEAGRAVGFIPVTPCSLGKRQPAGDESRRAGLPFRWCPGLGGRRPIRSQPPPVQRHGRTPTRACPAPGSRMPA